MLIVRTTVRHRNKCLDLPSRQKTNCARFLSDRIRTRISHLPGECATIPPQSPYFLQLNYFVFCRISRLFTRQVRDPGLCPGRASPKQMVLKHPPKPLPTTNTSDMIREIIPESTSRDCVNGSL
ncbi:hypothetical protein J6590_048073 [Homalodisca vitripennis]|nr:hypothetical protein J6590_048073 [Homalodisca vitripennis]